MTMPASPLHRVVPDRDVDWHQHRHPTTGRSYQHFEPAGHSGSPAEQASTTTGLFTVESSHRWKHSASTPQVAGRRIKSSEPVTLGATLMSPQRLGLPRIIFN